MNSDFWFNLPNGETAQELELTVPVEGRRNVSAFECAELSAMHDLLSEHMQKRGWTQHGPLMDELRSVVGGYESIASDALRGSESCRVVVLVWLRAIGILIESIVGDHLNHGQKNERLRGILGVLEYEVSKLRSLQFDFRGNTWDRGYDTFRWNEPERRLREKLDQLRHENDQLRSRLGDETNEVVPEPF